MGPDRVKETLKRALAMGVDRAIHILESSYEKFDHLQVAKTLSKAIAREPFDLVLCGRQAVDLDMAQIGPALAVYLDIPFITVVTKIKFD